MSTDLVCHAVWLWTCTGGLHEVAAQAAQQPQCSPPGEHSQLSGLLLLLTMQLATLPICDFIWLAGVEQGTVVMEGRARPGGSPQHVYIVCPRALQGKPASVNLLMEIMLPRWSCTQQILHALLYSLTHMLCLLCSVLLFTSHSNNMEQSSQGVL